MKKLALFMVLALMLTAMFSVSAFAATEGGEEADLVAKISAKISQYAKDIKEQFSGLNTTIKNLIPADFVDYLPLVLGALLLLECFFGYKLLGLQMFLAGAYVGLASGLLGFVHLTQTAGVNVPGDYVKWVIAALCAVVFALLFMALKKAGLVIFIGVYAFVELAAYTNNIIVQAAITAVIVLLSIFFFKYIFIHVTSLWGGIKGATLIFSAPLVAGAVDLSKYLINTPKAPAYYVGLLIAFFGVFVQLKLAKKRR